MKNSTKRRSNYEGTLRKISNNKWRARFPTGTYYTNGSMKYISKDFERERDALKWLTTRKYEFDKGILAQPNKTTFKDYCAYFLSVKNIKVKDTTLENYKLNLNKVICPVLGKIQLQALTHRHIQTFITDLINKGYKSNSIHYLFTLLKAVIIMATDEGIITKNITKGIVLPETKAVTKRILSKSEINKLLTNMKNKNYKTIVTICLYTGMRIGEVLGLRWENVDLDKRIIYVRDNLVTVDYKLILSTPKTPSSVRDIAIPKTLLDLLKNRERTCKYVIGTKNGTPIQATTVNRYLKAICKKRNLPHISPHDLRHTHASLLANNGGRILDISKHLGHADIQTTQIYLHTNDEQKFHTANLINNILK